MTRGEVHVWERMVACYGEEKAETWWKQRREDKWNKHRKGGGQLRESVTPAGIAGSEKCRLGREEGLRQKEEKEEGSEEVVEREEEEGRGSEDVGDDEEGGAGRVEEITAPPRLKHRNSGEERRGAGGSEIGREGMKEGGVKRGNQTVVPKRGRV